MADSDSKTMSQFARIGILLAWTLMCGSVWFAMVGSMGSANVDYTDDAAVGAVGAASCMVTGCVGGAWIFGVAVLALLYSFLRR